MELSEREEKILAAIIERYIAGGEPVGSKFLAESLPMTVSPATIRNEMAYLSENGYLSQPHTSAGRVPADKGYRYYIEKLLVNYTPSDSDMFRISSVVDAGEGDQSEILSQACSILSELTGCAVVATTPRADNASVAGTRVVSVGPHALMTVVSTTHGSVRTRIARTETEPDYDMLGLFYSAVSAGFADKRLEEINMPMLQTACANLSSKAIELIPLMVSFYDCVTDALRGDVIVKGIQNVLNLPELIPSAVGIARLLNSDAELSELFAMTSDDELEMKIGGENDYECLKNASVIKTSYGVGELSQGSVGILTSTKADYSGIIPLLKYTAEVLTDAMTGAAGNI